MNKKLTIISFFIYLASAAYGQSDSDSTFNSRLKLTTQFQNGSYINWFEPESENTYDISYSGIQTFHNTSLEGGFSYTNKVQKNTLWTYYSPEIYPYLLLEGSIKTNFSDDFSLYAGYYQTLTEKINLGIRTSYTNSISFNRTDPRFKIFGYKLELKPRIRVKTENLNLCIEPILNTSSREINMQIEGYYPFNIYQLLGLGFSQNVVRYEVYTGKIKQSKFGTNGNISYSKKRFSAGLDAKYNYGKIYINKSNISWSVLIPEAAIETSFLETNPFVRLNRQSVTHILSYTHRIQNKIGKEYIRRQMTDSLTSSERWEIYGITDKYQQADVYHNIDYGLHYKYSHKEISLHTGLESEDHREKYVGIVKDYTYRYKIITPHILLSYKSAVNKHLLVIEGGYSKRKFTLLNNEVLAGIATDDIYHREFNYLSGNAGILRLNGTFGTFHKLFGSESFSRFIIKSMFIRPENQKKMRSEIEISLQLDF